MIPRQTYSGSVLNSFRTKSSWLLDHIFRILYLLGPLYSFITPISLTHWFSSYFPSKVLFTCLASIYCYKVGAAIKKKSFNHPSCWLPLLVALGNRFVWAGNQALLSPCELLWATSNLSAISGLALSVFLPSVCFCNQQTLKRPPNYWLVSLHNDKQ